MTDYIKIARKLRRDQTDAEKLIWSKLRGGRLEGYKFRRQHPLPPYIADFFCERENLIVEIDGGQHTPEYDAERTAELTKRGHRIIRFWNNDVLENLDSVMETILMTFKDPSPSHAARGPLPLPKGEGEKRVCLGKIVSAHGVKGLVKILPFGENPLLIESLSPLYKGEASGDTISITMKNSAGNKYWLAAVKGVTERNGAEALRGTELWAGRDALPKIKEKNTYYHTDLIGLKVTEGNKEIGTIIAVQNYGAGDLLEIRTSGGTFLMPFTNDTCPEINIKGGFVRVVNASDYRDLA